MKAVAATTVADAVTAADVTDKTDSRSGQELS